MGSLQYSILHVVSQCFCEISLHNRVLIVCVSQEHFKTESWLCSCHLLIDGWHHPRSHATFNDFCSIGVLVVWPIGVIDWRHCFCYLLVSSFSLEPASTDLSCLQDSAVLSWCKSRKTRPPMAIGKVPPPQILLNPVVIHLEGRIGDENLNLSPFIVTPFPWM